MRGITAQVLHWGVQTDAVYHSGWILHEGGKSPSTHSVWELNHHGTCHPFFFFQIQKHNNRHVDSQVWLKSCEVLIGRFGSAPLPCRIFSFFFLNIFFFFNILSQTLVEFVADRFESFTLQCNWHPRKQHLLLQYVHTHVFLSNNIKGEQGKNDSHP